MGIAASILEQFPPVPGIVITSRRVSGQDNGCVCGVCIIARELQGERSAARIEVPRIRETRERENAGRE